MDCSVSGRISVSVDPCLFTKDNTDYSKYFALYPVKHAGLSTETMYDKTSPCSREITDDSTLVKWDFNYAEAESCGWAWYREEMDEQITFGSTIRPSDTFGDTVLVQDQTIYTSVTQNRDVFLECHYDSK